jgi:CubicO group peptidase (beta-lactamase class C family)
VTRLVNIDRDALRDELEAGGFSGVVHIVGGDDEPSLTIELGLADRSAGIPNTARTRFAVASISKLMTGMTCARLVDRGALSWAARYVDLVPEAWRPAALDPVVTVEHLLTHTSGFGDYFDEEGDEPYEAIWTRTPSTTIRGPRDMWPLLRDLPQVARPGSGAVYNNGAFNLLGIALETLTGLSFPELVRREVFEPIGMTRSGFWAFDDVVPELAIGYLPPAPDAGEGSPERAWRTNVFAVPAMGGPDGGAQTTVADLIRLLDALTGRGSPAADFLTADTRAHLTGPHVRSDDGYFGFGCGVLHVGEGEAARLGHTGEDPGASARAWSYPATGERVAVVSNVTDGAGAATRRIDALLANLPD